MKKLLLLFVFIGVSFFAKAQPLGNEWIDPTRVHYKFEISADGIYRIPYSVLSSHAIFGTTLSSLNLNTLVLFHNGEKVPIYISTSSNFGNSDYIEFYGEKNKGYIDSLLYRSADDQINPTYSLFTNTSVYYLTTNTGIPANPRYNVTANNINVSLTAEPYFMYNSQVNYPNGMYYAGKYVSQGQTELYKSIYDVGEGYTDNSYFGYVFSVLTPGIYTQGPDAIFRTTYANNSAGEFHDVKIIINNVLQSYSQSATGFQLNHAQLNIPVSQLNNGTTSVQYVDNGNGISQQKNVVGELSIEYPRSFNFTGLDKIYFEIDASASNKLLEITGFQDGGSQPVLYDITNGQIYRSVQPVGTLPLKFNLLPSAQKRSLYLRADIPSTFTFVGGLSPLNFTNYTNFNNQAEYYIITNSALLTLDANNINWVEEYRKYRDTKFAGARIADIDLLYDQFGYGIRKSPLAIRNFIRYLNTSTDIANKLHYVFLIGKAREAPTLRGGSGTAYNQCLVPTFGYPGSDNLLASKQAIDVPLVAIGRLAAENTTQIKNYLEKVRTYEDSQNVYACNQDIPSKEWQKEILHFSGGTTSFEQFAFKGYVDSYKKMAEDSLWGAHVTTYTKTSNAPIESGLAETIKAKINEGVSWITFFGHSATGAFDFSIDEPERYNNYGKYPIMLSNGCFSGFLHDAGQGYSEKFVFQPNAGMIAFMATSSLSISSGLNNFSTQLYKNTTVTKYNQPLGLGLKQTLTDLFQNPNTDDITKMTAYEMTLHGDPGLKPNHYPKPDYAVNATSVYTTPLTVTPGTDSFDVNVIVTNLGKCSVDDTLTNGKVVKSKIVVKLTRTIFDVNQNPVVYFYYKTIRAPFLRDTVVFTVPVNIGTLGYGENRFEPFVDAQDEIDETESAECNNTLQEPFKTIIKNDDIIPIYPYDFAIVPTKGVTLKASTINPFAPERAYRFEIDTSELFNSPKLRSTVITQIGGVVHCPTDITYYEKDSTVFYWRVRRDSIGNIWHYSSFIYLNGEYPGWNQSHHFQFQKDNYQNLRLDSFDRIFKFPPSTNQIHVRTGKSSAIGGGGNVDFETLGWDYNNYNQYRFRMGGCGYANPFLGSSGGLTFAVIDPVSGYPWYSHNFDADNWGDQYGNVHCSNKSGDQAGFDFNTTGFNPYKQTTWDTVIRNFIDAIPNGFYVLVYSVNNPPYTSWSPTLINALGQLGFVAQPFKSGAINGQLVHFTQKGNLSYNSFTATSNGGLSILDTSFTFQGAWYQGNFTTPKIGPAVEWRSVHWVNDLDFKIIPTDGDTLDIIGVKTNGSEIVLLRTIQKNILFYNGGPVIDAQEYPYLKLRLNTRDEGLRTPAQLDYWRVLYKKPPEAAINPAAHFVAPNNVNIGGKLKFEIGLENVTDVPMPNLLTKYIIRDAALNTYNYSIRYDTLGGLDTLHLVFDTLINQNSFIGLNKITIEANPDNDQIEQFHFNNFAEIDFSASGDKTNPLLDVTFDNQHILNGDIVSAEPNILIMLKDENKFLPLDRSSLFDIYIRYPGAAEPTKIDSTSSIFTFYAADGNNLASSNKAQIELKPIFTMDGTYELLIKDRDRSGNNSATTDSRYQGNNPATFFDYKISFEVITKPMITNVLNYPNPFTTATHFVFTITGKEVPDFMKIQIMTIKGTVVKEIFKEELGPLRVGRNITEYAWDGRDQYGDLLANGIYFYHVSTRLDDKQMDAMGMSYDKYFKKGFGKMAIVR